MRQRPSDAANVPAWCGDFADHLALDPYRSAIVVGDVAGAKRLADAERRVAEADQHLLIGLDAADRVVCTQMLAKLAANAGISVTCESVAEATEDCERETDGCT